MRSILKKLALVMSSPFRFSFTSGNNIIRLVIIKNLQKEASAAYDKLKVDTDIAVQKIVNDQSNPVIVEISTLKASISGLYIERQKQVEQRQAAILGKVQEYNTKLERYKFLNTRYEVLRPEIDALSSETVSKIAGLDQEISLLASELVELATNLDTQLQEAQVIIDRLNAYIDSVNNGTEVNQQEIQRIQDEFNALVVSNNQILDQEFANVQALSQELDNWIAVQNPYIDGLAANVDDAAVAYNNFLEIVRQREVTLDTYYANYTAAVANAQQAESIGDIETYNYWVGIANEWAALNDQENVYYQNDLITLSQLNASYLDHKRIYDTEFSRIQSELAAKQMQVDNALAAYNRLVEEKQAQTDQAEAEAEARIKELNNVIDTNIDNEKIQIEAIEKSIVADFGPQYAPYLDVIVKVAQDQDWNAALNTMLGLEREGHPGIERSFVIIEQVAAKKLVINVLTSTYQSQLSQFNALVQELNTLAANLESGGPEIDRLKLELENYIQESLSPIQELEASLAAKEKTLAEELGGRVQALYTLRDLQSELVKQQTLVLSSVLTNGEETATLKAAYDQAKDALLAQDPATIPIDLIAIIAAKSLAPVEEVIEVEAYQNQSILSTAVLAGDEKILTIKRWWNLLRRENDLGEEAITLTNLFNQSDVDTWKFLDVLFANGFFVEPAIEKVIFTDSERTGYRVVVDGGTYWLNEAGRLIASDDLSSILFDAVFTTPSNTVIGKSLRAEQVNLKELFKSFEQYDSEKKNALVLAESLLREADQLESEAEKQKFLNIAKSIGEIVIGITPAGDSVDAYECLTGTTIYGDPIGVEGQVLAAAGLIIGSRVFWEKTLILLSKGFKKLQRILGREASEVTEAMVQEAKVIANNTPIPPIFKATGFTSADKLRWHFNKHAKKWGDGVIKTEAEYLERALALNNSKVGGDILGFTSPEGYVFRFNQATNEFVVATPTGLVQTFLKPDNPAIYYQTQVERYAPKI